MNIIQHLLNNLRLLGELSKKKPVYTKCSSCSYEFKELRPGIRICGKCLNNYLIMSLKKKDKMLRRYKQNPTVCPICAICFEFKEIKPNILLCKKCGALIPI